MKKEDFLKVVRAKAKEPLTEQEESMFGAIGQAVESAFEQDSVERNKKLEEVAIKLDGRAETQVVRDLAAKFDAFEEKTKRGLSADDKFKLRTKLEEKKDEITSAMRSTVRGEFNQGKDWAIEFRAARAASAMMTTSSILTGATAINSTSIIDDLEVLVIQYPKNFAVDAIRGRQIATVPAYIRWREQNPIESTSDLGLTEEGGEKKKTDKHFVWKNATRVKYTGRIEFTEELAMDFDQLLMMTIDMFEQQVIRAWNSGIQTALFAYASAYTTTGLDGFFVAPGLSQVIQAGKLWITNRFHEPDLLFISPANAAKALIQQNLEGDIVYIPEAVAFNGLTPFVSTLVPDTEIYIGTSNLVKEMHSNFIMRRGQYGEQLIHNEETIIGEVFSLLKLPTITQNSWLKLEVAPMLQVLTKNNA